MSKANKAPLNFSGGKWVLVEDLANSLGITSQEARRLIHKMSQAALCHIEFYKDEEGDIVKYRAIHLDRNKSVFKLAKERIKLGFRYEPAVMPMRVSV